MTIGEAFISIPLFECPSCNVEIDGDGQFSVRTEDFSSAKLVLLTLSVRHECGEK